MGTKIAPLPETSSLEADFRLECFPRMGKSFPIGYFTALLSGSQHCRTVYYLPVQHGNGSFRKDTGGYTKIKRFASIFAGTNSVSFASLPRHFPVKVLEVESMSIRNAKAFPAP